MKYPSKRSSPSMMQLMLVLLCLWLAACDGGSISSGFDISPQFSINCTNGGILYGSFSGNQCPAGWVEADFAEFPELVCNPPGPFNPGGPILGFHVDADECPAGWTEFNLMEFDLTPPPSGA